MKKTVIATSIFALAATSQMAVAQKLEEVIVTAQKREQTLSDVPISMSAISGELIEDAGIASFRELGAYVPNLSISENAVNTIISMRGIGVGAQQSFEQSVGVFVDGVHLGKSRQTRLGLFDLERVEVLRGPQGILFGKNTLAGAINVTSASPVLGGDLEGRIAISSESFDGRIYEGWLQTSITDNFALRFALKDRQLDGYLDNSLATAVNGATPDGPTTDEQIWRLSAKWQPGENTDIDLKYTESDYVRVGGPATVKVFGMLDPAGTPASNLAMYALMGIVFPTFSGSQSDLFRDAKTLGGDILSGGTAYGGPLERDEGTDTQNEEWSLNIEHEFGNGLTLNYVYGDSYYQFEDGIDADFLPVQFIGRADDSEYDQQSHELRLAGSAGEAFDWVGGVNVVDSTQKIERIVAIDGTLGYPDVMRAITGGGNPALGLPTFLNFTQAQLDALTGGLVPRGVEGLSMFSSTGRLSYWQQDTQSWAAFFQGTYRLNDQLSVTAGIRYTEEDKDVIARTDVSTGATGLGNPVAPAANPLFHGLMAAAFDTYAHAFDESRSTSQVTPAITVQYEPDDSTNYYISYAEGFKSGGFNSVDDQNPVIQADGTILRNEPGVGFEYDDETASSIEIGGKHTLMDGAMQLNWSVYSAEYEDLQVSTFVGLGFVVANAATAEIQGLEVDLNYQVTEKLRVALAFALNDGEYGSFPGAGCTQFQQNALNALNIQGPNDPQTSAFGCQQKFLGDGTPSGASQDLKGGQIGTEYNGSVQVEYIQPLSNDVAWFSSLDYNFTDDYFLTGDLDPLQVQNGYGLFNFRTGLRAENWMIMAYGRNITDELYAQGGFSVPLAQGSQGTYMTPGETYGIQVSYQF